MKSRIYQFGAFALLFVSVLYQVKAEALKSLPESINEPAEKKVFIGCFSNPQIKSACIYGCRHHAEPGYEYVNVDFPREGGEGERCSPEVLQNHPFACICIFKRSL